MTRTEPNAARRESSFQPWMVANFAVGAGFSAFISLLIPPYVTQVSGGEASAAGVVMGIISLGAILGPVLGTWADRYRAHRLVMSGGVLGMALGFALFAGASKTQELFALDAIFLGVSLAAVSAVGPTFIIGARLSQQLEARRMTTYSLAMPVGQVVGGLALGAANRAGWEFTSMFWLAAVMLFGAFLVTWFTSAGPARRIAEVLDEAGGGGAGDTARSQPSSVSLRAVLFSAFGLFLAISVFTSIANNGINSQIANILPNVYGISAEGVSALVALAGLLNIVLFIPAGRMMARRGAYDVYRLGVILRLGGALGMAVVGAVANSAELIAVAFMQLLYQGSPFARLAQPGTAMRFATFSAGIANGWLIAASAVGSLIGSLGGGFLADKFGFNSVNWFGAGAAAVSVLLLIVWLTPINRAQREAAPAS